jgi:5-methyltetrahydropteroyltriglutamate--homocysteine methyltransferase
MVFESVPAITGDESVPEKSSLACVFPAILFNGMHRILTTHVGSLPRSQDVVDLLFKREQDAPYDPAEFDRVMTQAVSEIVRKQVEIGLDIVSDGETSKIGYATYVKDRLTGFGGDNPRPVALDLEEYPEFRARMAVFTGKQSFKRQSCVGPVQFIGHDELTKDIANLRAAVEEHHAHQGFMNAASPGVVSAFQPNRFYSTQAEYLEAIGSAMQFEYEAIVNAGLLLQLDCPDLAMARHTGFQDLTDAEFLKQAEHQVEVLNHALRNIPASSVRMHVCWGNYEGPHDHDIALEKIIGIILKAKPAGIQFEASNPRHAHEWVVWKNARIPAGKILIPGLLTSTSNYVEHPELVALRIVQYANIVGRDRVIAGTDCGFGTFAGIGKMDSGISFKKLQALVQGAELASKRLW